MEQGCSRIRCSVCWEKDRYSLFIDQLEEASWSLLLCMNIGHFRTLGPSPLTQGWQVRQPAEPFTTCTFPCSFHILHWWYSAECEMNMVKRSICPSICIYSISSLPPPAQISAWIPSALWKYISWLTPRILDKYCILNIQHSFQLPVMMEQNLKFSKTLPVASEYIYTTLLVSCFMGSHC